MEDIMFAHIFHYGNERVSIVNPTKKQIDRLFSGFFVIDEEELDDGVVEFTIKRYPKVIDIVSEELANAIRESYQNSSKHQFVPVDRIAIGGLVAYKAPKLSVNVPGFGDDFAYLVIRNADEPEFYSVQPIDISILKKVKD